MNGLRLRILLDDLRSAGNVGSILRTADATAVEQVYACGTTPYPHVARDNRPPHIASANHRAIAKTALGAEATIPVTYYPQIATAIAEAIKEGFTLMLIEQSEKSLNLYDLAPLHEPTLIVLGNEVTGINLEIAHPATRVVEIPMLGNKESLNVSVAAAVVLYQLRFNH